LCFRLILLALEWPNHPRQQFLNSSHHKHFVTQGTVAQVLFVAVHNLNPLTPNDL
jgi:hypothetical protein